MRPCRYYVHWMAHDPNMGPLTHEGIQGKEGVN